MDKLSVTVNKVLETGISRAQLSRELGLGSGAIITKWGSVKRAHTQKQFESIKIIRGMLQIDDKLEIEELEIEEGQSLVRNGEELQYSIRDNEPSEPGEKREAKQITVMVKGEKVTGTITDLARRFGQKPVTVYTRLRNGYTNEEAFGLIKSSRIRSRRTINSDSDSRSTITLTLSALDCIGAGVKPVDKKGKTQGVREWAEELNLKEPTIRGRMKRGWDPKRILTTPSPSLA